MDFNSFKRRYDNIRETHPGTKEDIALLLAHFPDIARTATHMKNHTSLRNGSMSVAEIEADLTAILGHTKSAFDKVPGAEKEHAFRLGDVGQALQFLNDAWFPNSPATLFLNPYFRSAQYLESDEYRQRVEARKRPWVEERYSRLPGEIVTFMCRDLKVPTDLENFMWIYDVVTYFLWHLKEKAGLKGRAASAITNNQFEAIGCKGCIVNSSGGIMPLASMMAQCVSKTVDELFPEGKFSRVYVKPEPKGKPPGNAVQKAVAAGHEVTRGRKKQVVPRQTKLAAVLNKAAQPLPDAYVDFLTLIEPFRNNLTALIDRLPKNLRDEMTSKKMQNLISGKAKLKDDGFTLEARAAHVLVNAYRGEQKLTLLSIDDVANALELGQKIAASRPAETPPARPSDGPQPS